MIKLIKSTFFNEYESKKELAKFILSAKQLSFGKKCNQFESKFAKWQDRNHCVMLNSGSSANLAILQALLNLGRLKKGDKIGFSAVTWSTNVMPIIQLGLIPIPIDVEINTLNISSKLLEKSINKTKIKALFITNLLGFCDDLDLIQSICKAKNIILLEDNCESLGSIYRGTKLGNFGLASTFSFYVGHHMSTIEGGAVCTDDEELDTMLRLVRAHGWDRNLTFAKQGEMRLKHKINSPFYSRYTFYDLGYNLRPTEINGFLGVQQLKHINKVNKIRQNNFINFYENITNLNLNKFFPLRFDHMDFLSNFAFPLICKSETYRNKLVKLCEGKIEIRPIVGGDITAQPFFKRYSQKSFNCPNAKLIHDQGLYFGNNPDLSKSEINKIIKCLND